MNRNVFFRNFKGEWINLAEMQTAYLNDDFIYNPEDKTIELILDNTKYFMPVMRLKNNKDVMFLSTGSKDKATAQKQLDDILNCYFPQD